MYLNDLFSVDLVEIPRGPVCISRGVIRAYIVFAIYMSCFASNFLSRAFRTLKKKKKRKKKAKLSKTCWNFGKKKTKRFFPITKCNLKK